MLNKNITALKLILISYPENIDSEHDILLRLFEEGLEYFHLRKPGMSSEKMGEYIKKIPQEYHNRIILHSNVELLLLYDLKGIHFTKDTKHLVDIFSDYDAHKSISCHWLDELNELNSGFEYAFLGPVFDSISKPGYKSSLCNDRIKTFINKHDLPFQVIALGGINEERIEECRALGFDGVAILGSVWNSFLECKCEKEIIEKFKRTKEECLQIVPM